MPVRNSRKTYIKNGYYHIYNRGVEKRTIYLDDRDYRTFLSFIKRYLAPDPDPLALKARPSLRPGLDENISLLAYCLMPNHFHLLLKQNVREAMSMFLQKLNTSYVIYFNKRHQRRGPLFEGRYKAVSIETDEQLLHISRYVHRNPQDIWAQVLATFPYSSYANYLGERKSKWLKSKEILSFFSTRHKQLSYTSFVEKVSEEEMVGSVKGLTLE